MPAPGWRGRRVLLGLAPLLLLAARPAPRTGELVLDATDPVVAVTLAGVPLRLRVDLAAQDAVELNPEAAARLALRWEEGLPIDVGRVRLPGREATAVLAVRGTTTPVLVAEHGRPCCADADGAIAPGLLPVAAVRWVRADAPAADGERTLPLQYRPETGYAAPGPADAAGVRIRFDPFSLGSSGTAAAGALLARAWSGRWAGPPTRLAAAFGVERPVRPIAFGRPGRLAGFPVAMLPVRLADFGGSEALPSDPADADAIVVRRRIAPQRAWPAVTLGADRLDRCREIRFTAAPLALTLVCAFG